MKPGPQALPHRARLPRPVRSGKAFGRSGTLPSGNESNPCPTIASTSSMPIPMVAVAASTCASVRLPSNRMNAERCRDVSAPWRSFKARWPADVLTSSTVPPGVVGGGGGMRPCRWWAQRRTQAGLCESGFIHNRHPAQRTAGPPRHSHPGKARMDRRTGPGARLNRLTSQVANSPTGTPNTPAEIGWMPNHRPSASSTAGTTARTASTCESR